MFQINFQSPVKTETNANGRLLIHSIFHTIQGEGPNVGQPAVFVRLGGCNLQCPGCDTEYTKGSAWEDVESICTRVVMAHGIASRTRLVVLTGGEPLRQNIVPLVNKLISQYGYIVQIETNGTQPIHNVDQLTAHCWRDLQVVVSPKAGKVDECIWPFIRAYKYVLDAEHVDFVDGLPKSVLGMPARPARPYIGYDGPIYVQPAEEHEGSTWELSHYKNTKNLRATINSCMKFGYYLCIQTHKIAGLE